MKLFNEVLVPAASWFAARIGERADYVSLLLIIGSKVSSPSWGVKRSGRELVLSGFRARGFRIRELQRVPIVQAL